MKDSLVNRITKLNQNILKKTTEGYLDSILFLTFKTIIIKKVHAVHSSRYLQSKLMFRLSHTLMVNIQCISKWF